MIQEKERENQQITQQASLAQAESKRQRQIANISITSASIFGLLLLALTYSWNILKKQKKKISEQNDVIKAQQDELRHRTKNVLTRTRYMLKKATKNVNDKDSKQLLAKTESMILASASLEEFLYGIDDEKKVPYVAYLKVLVNKLVEMYDTSTQKINFRVEAESEFDLPVDMLIPTSLIVTELVTNALKHAYPNIVNPMLWINLLKNGDSIYVTIKDNGVGLLNTPSNGMGHLLVDKFVAYIKGELKVAHDNGTTYTLIFSTKNY